MRKHYKCELSKGNTFVYIFRTSHIAFSVGSREEVIRLTNQLIEDGYLIYSNVRETGDGYFESCISDPFGNRVEITV